LNHFSAITGYPIFLDVAHPLRFQVVPQLASAVVGHYDVLGRIGFMHENQPELIVHLGAPLTSGAWEQWMERAERGVVIHAITRDGWPDPGGTAATVTMGNPTEIIRELSKRITKSFQENKPRKNSWITKWQKADELVRQKIAEVSQSIEFGEGVSVFTAVRTCPSGIQLVLGNSLPIREVDFWCGAESREIITYTIRGANGIDGMISAAAGIAEGTKKKTMLLVGDISFLHDIGGLFIASQIKTPLVLLVINNGGGRIFDQLPVGQMIKLPELEWWTTPHSMQFAHMAAQFGIVYNVISGKNELIQELEKAWNYSGVSLLEVLVNSRSASEQIKKIQCAIKESSIL
jgi:2-succinyl-5-enolpyruvyl-6-hydroxy-3-cyclohexene-1-carboxylate synthase